MPDADAKPDKGAEDPKQRKDGKLTGKAKQQDTEPDLSEEDQELKANLEMMVERARDKDSGIQANALEARASFRHSDCTALGCTLGTGPTPTPNHHGSITMPWSDYYKRNHQQS